VSRSQTPKGFVAYEPKCKASVIESSEPLVLVQKHFLVLNTALLRRVKGLGWVKLLWNADTSEMGLWFWKSAVPGALKLCGNKRSSLRWVAFSGFRRRFMDGAPIEKQVLLAHQSPESREFFVVGFGAAP
jgi:hypothetical protein